MTRPGDEPPRGDASPDDGPEPVGSVGEEAARLFAAVGDLARDRGGQASAGWGGLLDDLTHAAHDAGVGDAPECRWCPVCRVLRAVREATSPEVRAHLGAAASSLAQAAAVFLEPPTPPDPRSGSPERPDDEAPSDRPEPPEEVR